MNALQLELLEAVGSRAGGRGYRLPSVIEEELLSVVDKLPADFTLEDAYPVAQRTLARMGFHERKAIKDSQADIYAYVSGRKENVTTPRNIIGPEQDAGERKER